MATFNYSRPKDACEITYAQSAEFDSCNPQNEIYTLVFPRKAFNHASRTLNMHRILKEDIPSLPSIDAAYKKRHNHQASHDRRLNLAASNASSFPTFGFLPC